MKQFFVIQNWINDSFQYHSHHLYVKMALFYIIVLSWYCRLWIVSKGLINIPPVH